MTPQVQRALTLSLEDIRKKSHTSGCDPWQVKCPQCEETAERLAAILETLRYLQKGNEHGKKQQRLSK